MNFSNFIIDKLTDTEPKLAIGNKKAGSNAFLFSDIIKVCEQENSPQATGELDTSKVDSGLEIYASSENVIKVSSEEFESIGQFINSLISQNGEINVSGTHHKVDNALIEKLQFVIPEDKLIELSGDFIDKSSFSLIPLTSTTDLSEFTKPLTISYKNGSNKLSITISPIKVDENSTSRIINDEFSFVNNLIVNEGLLPNAPVILSETKTNSEEEAEISENSLIEENPEYFDLDKASSEPAAKIFYKAEIIKIEAPQVFVEPKLQLISLNGDSNQESISNEVTPQSKLLAVDDINVFKFSANSSNYELFKNLQQSSELKSDSVISEQEKEGFKNITPLDTPLVENSKTEIKDISANTAKVSNEQGLVISADKSVQNQKTPSTALSYLMDGLTEEEKSIFKGFATSGEMQEIKLTKQSQTVPKIEFATAVSAVESSVANTNSTEIETTTDSALAETGIKADSNSVLEKNQKLELETMPDANEKVDSPKYKISGSDIDEAKPGSVKSEPATISIKEEKASGNKAEIRIEEQLVKKSSATAGIQTDKTALTKNEYRPKLISREEFLTTKSEIKTSATIEVETSEVVSPESLLGKEKQNAKEEALLNENNLAVTAEGKLLVKVAAKASVKVEKNLQEVSEIKNKSSQNVDEESKTSEIKINVDTEEKRVVDSAKPNTKKSDKSEQFVLAASVENTQAKEKKAETKTEIETKVASANESKEIKHAAAEQQLNQNTEKENTKSNSSEAFKNNINQVSGSEKSFSAESLKLQSEPKLVHEQFKTIKQQEIIPEFSKLIQQGEKQTLTLQLTPENLGKVKLTVDIIENQIVTKIEVENEQVKQFVQSNVEQLKQNMQSAGIPLTNVNVSLSDDQKNQKVFTQKKKSSGREDKEEVIEETSSMQAKKHMGYNTYEFTA